MIDYLFEDVPAAGGYREVVPGVYWLRMPLPLALDHINLYLLEDDDGWWLVDTGIGLGPTQELWEEVFTSLLGAKPVKGVIATHYHPDHIGMAGWLCERWQVPLYMTHLEYLTGLTFSRISAEHFSWNSQQHLRRCGYSPEQLEQARQRHGGFSSIIKPMPTAFTRLVDGGSLHIGGHDWEVVVGRGHSPEHACLYSASLNVLISGDQVIPGITSNVSVMGTEPDANPLRDWLASHQAFLQRLPADALVLPAHRAPFRGLHQRLESLVEHHQAHLLDLEAACADAESSAMELLPVLFKRELDEHHIGLAVGECVAHLNFLHQAGRLSRQEDEEGVYRYRSIDKGLPQRLRDRPATEQKEAPIQA